MRVLLPLVCLVIAPGLEGQGGLVRPEFSSYQVDAASGGWRGWLWPEEAYSIYGTNLGPEQSCVRDAGSYHHEWPSCPDDYDRLQQILPRELCGVEVLLDGAPVPLLYVHSRQINFLVPRSGPVGDKVSLRVIHRGVSSLSVPVKFGPDRIMISQQEQAYTGLPVWVRVSNVSESNSPMELMFSIGSFGSSRQCPHIEVKYNGVSMPELQVKSPLRQFTYSGPPCPTQPWPKNESLAGRIPLHLRYAFEHPGIYQVRYVAAGDMFGQGLTADSQWTPVEVKAGTEVQRTKWLRGLVPVAPTGREGLIYDFLPSIFGYGDTGALYVALEYLYHPDSTVAGTDAFYLRNYYTAPVLLQGLEQIVKRRGTNRVVTQLLRDLGATPMAR